jgi:outer membrane protein assembly factor BamB
MNRFPSILPGVALILILSFASCGKEGPESVQPEPGETAPTEAVTETEELPPVKPPEHMQGIITFFSGNVYILHGQDEFIAEIGDHVEKEDVLIVEAASYCEVQFGDTAVIRIQENTEVAMKDINVSPGGSDVNLDMKTGSVLCKVKKLTGAEDFKVQTQTAVCGVRGTEFSVTADERKKTVLAVKEGAVAVLPSSVDIDMLKEQAGEENEELIAILEDLEKSAPVVSANEEINLDEKTLEETDKAVRAVEKIVMEIVEEAKQPVKTGKIDPAKLASLSKAVEKTKQEVAKKVAPPGQISPANKEKLDKIDDLTMIEVKEPKLVKIAVRTEPASAAITVNGREVGSGAFSGIYAAGEELRIYIAHPGYHDHTLEIIASKETGKLYKVKLMQDEGQDRAETEGISTAEKPGSGTAEGTAAAAADKGTADKTAVKEAGGKEQAVMGAVEITARPADAAILLDGKQVATGTYRGRHEAGSTLTFTVTRRGYARQKIEARVTEEGTGRTVTLIPLPVEVDVAVSKSPIVGNLIVDGNRIIAADGDGSVYAVDIEGKLIWRVDTKNSPNENSSPLLIGGRIYFSGSKELVVIAPDSGRVIQQTALDGSSAHLFGRRAVETAGTVYFPANNDIRVLDTGSGSFGREIPIPKGSRMTPAVWKGKLVIANLEGSLLIIDPAAKNPVLASVSTAAVQPIAIAPTIIGDLAVFSGRKGTMVCVDLSSEKTVWEKKLPGNASVFTDIACDGKGLYAYAKGRIFAVSLQDGSDLFPSIENATSAPLCSGDRFYYGSGNYLVYRKAGDGSVIKQIEVSGQITARPAAAGAKITAGTSTGHILVMNP